MQNVALFYSVTPLGLMIVCSYLRLFAYIMRACARTFYTIKDI